VFTSYTPKSVRAVCETSHAVWPSVLSAVVAAAEKPRKTAGQRNSLAARGVQSLYLVRALD
jgi:hypothetical protein